MGYYWAFFCPDNRRLAPGLRLHKVLRSHDLSGRIGLRQWNVIVQRRAELTDSGCPINNSYGPELHLRRRMEKGIAPATAESVRGVLRNPLVVFGLVFLAGDGPLVVAYAVSSDPTCSITLMWATIAFIFFMGGIFCYLVTFKPRHLYAPDQIPEGVIEKSLYTEPKLGKDVLSEAQDLVEDLRTTDNQHQREAIAGNINARLQIANQVQNAYELLLIPGYDVSLILEILDSIRVHKRVNSSALAHSRSITPSTIDIILESMERRRSADEKHGEWYLTGAGIRLQNSLREYLNAGDASNADDNEMNAANQT